MLIASSPMPVKDVKAAVDKGGNATISWTSSPEKGVHSYIVKASGSLGSFSATMNSGTASLTIGGLKLKKGETLEVSVKAVVRELESWDWARASAVAK
jgi:hypothetical protein